MPLKILKFEMKIHHILDNLNVLNSTGYNFYEPLYHDTFFSGKKIS